LQANLPAITDALAAGAIVVIEPLRNRVRPFADHRVIAPAARRRLVPTGRRCFNHSP
jgi:hypothetical protein